jgi:hypothetical protein
MSHLIIKIGISATSWDISTTFIEVIPTLVEPVDPMNPYWRETISTVDLLIKIACLCKK